MRVLVVSPHFPPDSSAGTHRVRLLAPYLARHGWEPTVVTVDPRDVEGRLDPSLSRLVPGDVEVVRVRALPARATRRLGLGDLGLRAFPSLLRECASQLARRKHDALFVTIYPTYPAMLGPLLKKRFRVPFVLDYQDPWVSEWGRSVGPGAGGRPDGKSRVVRWIAQAMEPLAARAADGVTAVSRGTLDDVARRHPSLNSLPSAEIPIGFDARDLAALEGRPPNPHFDARDGNFHLCAVGTYQPLGGETLRALFSAVRRLRETRPDLHARLRLRFFGTSNQSRESAPARVLPVAEELGVADVVSEVPGRLDYLDALTVLRDAGAILLLGTSEPHYTASRLFPALMSARPILAIFHAASTVSVMLPRASPSARLVTYDDRARAGSREPEIAAQLTALIEAGALRSAPPALDVVSDFGAPALAGKLARVLDAAVARR
jgi:glycosyltransferase involved in cell wall biosynthesis